MASHVVKKVTPASKRTVRRGAPPVIRPRRRRDVDRGEPPDAAYETAAALELEAEGETSAPVQEEARASKANRDSGNNLATYFREMAELDVLKPDQELEAAQAIESLELALWEELLVYAPLTDYVLSLFEPELESPIAALRALRRAAGATRSAPTKANETKLRTAARKTAEALREADTDKLWQERVMLEFDHIARGLGEPASGKRPRVVPSSKAFREHYRRVRVAARAAESARNDFVRANLRLVVSIARRFNHGRMALADLIQEGNLGLMKAVERYDYRRGFRFSTYASWWIRHAISRALADKGREVRLPVHMIDAQHRISKATRELTAKLGRQPTSQEIAKAANIAAGKIDKMRTYLVDQSFSLDRPVNDEDGRSLAEYLQDPNADESSPIETMAADSMTLEMQRVLDELKPIEADILRKRFGFDDDNELTLKEIGKEYNLSRERIRQLQEQALSKMRRALARKDLL
jgi:RNA polymerase primary sigma factor